MQKHKGKHPYKFISYINVTWKFTAFLRPAA
jgi:hypothetical protein